MDLTKAPYRDERGRIIFPDRYPSSKPGVVDYGSALRRVRFVRNEAIVELKYSDAEYPILRKLSNTGFELWTLEPRGSTHQLDVSENDELLLDCKPVGLQGRLRQAVALSQGVAVLVHANDFTGGRNLYFFDWHGRQLWQVGRRTRFPQLPYGVIRSESEGELEVIGNGTRVFVDLKNGSVTSEESWKE